MLDEDKALKFGTELVIYKFLNNTGLKDSPKAQTVLGNLNNLYLEIKPILENIIENQDSKKIWLTALITDILFDVAEFLPIVEQLIDRSLVFIKNHYIENNYRFTYDVDSDIRRDISPKFRETIQTALIAKTILRSDGQQTRNIFEPVLDNLFKNRSNFIGDHVTAIAAYTLAFHKEFSNAHIVLGKVEHGYSKKKTFPRHYTMYVEVISYVILTKIMLNQDPKEHVKALLKHRNAEGAFYSSYDTYLALKALSEYSIYRNVGQSNFVFYLDSKSISIGQLQSRSITVTSRKQRLIANSELGYINTFYEDVHQPAENFAAINLTEVYLSRVRHGEINIYMKFFYFYDSKDSLWSNLVALEVDLPEGYVYSNYEAQNDIVVSI